MPELSLAKAVYLLGVGGFTLAALISDVRTKRIPNILNVVSLAVALLVHMMFYSGLNHETFYHGLGYALGGFAVGFGVLFVLWMVGGGGGGDVKMMGALGAWLGPKQTITVLGIAAVFVVILTMLVAVWSLLTRGISGTRKKYLPESEDPNASRKKKKKNRKTPLMSVEQRKQRRVMAYAVPVALATWLLLGLDLFGQLPPLLK
ncbi:MAG: hypothetical protein Tsb009_27630 [Planctomycetaceae bacterium]